MFRLHRRVADLQDLIIVGAGGAALAALIAIIEQHRNSTIPLSITILERSAHAGDGFPYDPALHHPILRVNNPNSGMILNLDHPLDFVNWLRDNADTLKAEHPELAQIIDDNNSGKDRYAPRMIFGLYCQARLKDYVNNAKQLGITVTVITNTNIIDATQDSDNNWHLKSENDETYIARNILLATGHMPSCKFPTLRNIPGYYDSPYTDLSNLHDKPAFIIGSGLSAIDAAKLLVHQQVTAPIYMISPSGQLPRVKGPASAITYKMKFLTEEKLDKKNIRLNEVLELFSEELKHATDNSAWTLASIMRMARLDKSDPLRTLQREINWVENNKVRGWQLMLGQLWYMPIPLLWKNIDDRDRHEFLKNYFPLFLKWTAGMTLNNAKEMLALAEMGQLRLIKTNNEIIFNDSSKQFEIRTADNTTLVASTVINATGTGFDIENNSLLHTMAKRGLIQRGRFRGGFEMTSDANLISANNEVHHNAWAIGIATSNNNIDASSIEMAAYAAKKFAGNFHLKLQLDHAANPPISKPSPSFHSL